MVSKPDKPDKVQWHLLPWSEIAQVARVFMHGNTKYDPHSWKLVSSKKEKYFDSAMRHLMSWFLGEPIDESGLPHLAHSIACILILLWEDNNINKGEKG